VHVGASPQLVGLVGEQARQEVRVPGRPAGGVVAARQERRRDGEAEQATGLEQVERAAQRRGDDVADADRGDRDERREALLAQVVELLRRPGPEVAGQVVRVDAGTVALGGVAGHRFEVEPDDVPDAGPAQRLAADAVARAEVEHPLPGRVEALALESIGVEAHDLPRRAHAELLVEDPLVQAGDRVDRGVVMKADPLTRMGRTELDPLLRAR
jgi:hypothetical protein